MTHGWSSRRGQARHLLVTDHPVSPAWCGAPIRIRTLDAFPMAVRKRLKALEVCDHCQNAKRRNKMS